jgi:hypothetical protein
MPDDTWERMEACIWSGIYVERMIAAGEEIVPDAQAQLDEARSLLVKAGCNEVDCRGHHTELLHAYWHVIRTCQNSDCEGSCDFCTAGLMTNNQRYRFKQSLPPKEEEEG